MDYGVARQRSALTVVASHPSLDLVDAAVGDTHRAAAVVRRHGIVADGRDTSEVLRVGVLKGRVRHLDMERLFHTAKQSEIDTRDGEATALYHLWQLPFIVSQRHSECHGLDMDNEGLRSHYALVAFLVDVGQRGTKSDLQLGILTSIHEVTDIYAVVEAFRDINGAD